MIDCLAFLGKVKLCWTHGEDMNCAKNTKYVKQQSLLTNDISLKVRTRRTYNWIHRRCMDRLHFSTSISRTRSHMVRIRICKCKKNIRNAHSITVNSTQMVVLIANMVNRYDLLTETFQNNSTNNAWMLKIATFNRSLLRTAKSINPLSASNDLRYQDH